MVNLASTYDPVSVRLDYRVGQRLWLLHTKILNNNFFLFSCFVQTTQELTIHQKFKAQTSHLHLPARIYLHVFLFAGEPSSRCEGHDIWHTLLFR
jgi:hypothetical protein